MDQRTEFSLFVLAIFGWMREALLRKLGREIGAFAVRRLAIDAGMAFPDVFSQHDLGGQRHASGGFCHHIMVSMHGQHDKDNHEEMRSRAKYVARP